MISARRREKSPASDADDLSDASFEDDEFDAAYRERRLAMMQAEHAAAQALRDNNHGRLNHIRQEKEVLQLTAKAPFAIVHFFHPDFRRCQIMDRHLETLAARHYNTLFLRVDVADVPFLVERFEIRILPCVLTLVGGVTKDRITGFEGLAETEGDGFTTAQLELRLHQSGPYDDASIYTADAGIGCLGVAPTPPPSVVRKV